MNDVKLPADLIAWITAISPITGRELLAGFGTLVASFAGAWFAFRFAKYQRQRETRENEVASGNRALFTLSIMLNALNLYNREIIDPWRGKPDT
jgi:hypothetical protein